jgi:hypothetical protein
VTHPQEVARGKQGGGVNRQGAVTIPITTIIAADIELIRIGVA